jgi:glycosyltransferase involved in cell wall biosynthesis
VTTTRPLVSILTPSFNQGEYIRDTLDSVAAQDYPDIEHIVVDGGSTDTTLATLADRDRRLIYISEPDRGQADALNKAFARARGSIIGWLNSDDFYLSGGIVRQVVDLFAASNADVVYGNAVWVDERRKVVKLRPSPSFSSARLERFDYISQPATFFRRDGVRDPLVDRHLNYALDYGLWLQLLKDGRRFVRCDRYLAAMRYHAEAKSVRARESMWLEDIEVRHETGPRVRSLFNMAADVGVMSALKLRGLADFRSARLDPDRRCVPLTFPPLALRPLYQVGLLGCPGSALLFPRYLFSTRRHIGAGE